MEEIPKPFTEEYFMWAYYYFHTQINELEDRGTRIRTITSHKRRLEVALAFGHICDRCGNTNLSDLSYHHLDPSQKEYTPADLFQRGSLDKILVEAAKCSCLCRDCHDIIHQYDIEYEPQIQFSKSLFMRLHELLTNPIPSKSKIHKMFTRNQQNLNIPTYRHDKTGCF